MKPIKIIGALFIFYFLIILALILWNWYQFTNNSSTTDFGGLVLLALLFLVVYYYSLIVWTWQLTMRNLELSKKIKIQFSLIFVFGILTSLVYLVMSLRIV